MLPEFSVVVFSLFLLCPGSFGEASWLPKVRYNCNENELFVIWPTCVWIGKYHTKLNVGPLRVELKIHQKVSLFLSIFLSFFLSVFLLFFLSFCLSFFIFIKACAFRFSLIRFTGRGINIETSLIPFFDL